MQKKYTISCCGECPAFVKRGNQTLCVKKEFTFEQDTSNPVDLTLIGFPEWCPLPDAEIVGDSMGTELKRIARQILKRLDWDFDDDVVSEISRYLSTVVDVKDFKREKEKAAGSGLFSLPAS
jgi:hypothetical protein